MSGKTSYAILISFMALFALAAQAKEPAAAQYSAVMAAVRAGNQAAMKAALERYSARLSVEFAPKKVAKVIPLEAHSKPIAKIGKIAGRKIASVGQPIAPVGQPIGQPLSAAYQNCLKSGPAECCAVINDASASMPDSCGSRSLASQSSDEMSAPIAATEEKSADTSVAASSSAM